MAVLPVRMDLAELPDATTVLVVAASVVALLALLLAFQHPTCPSGPSTDCGPNVVALVLATVAAAVAALAFGYGRGLGGGTESE